MVSQFQLLAGLALVFLGTLANLAAAQPLSREPTYNPPCDGHQQILWPKPGQIVDRKKPLEVVYCSDAYFKIGTLAPIEIVWTPATRVQPGFVAGVVVGQMSPNSTLGLAGYNGTVQLPTNQGAKGEVYYLSIIEKEGSYPVPATQYRLSSVNVKLA